MKKLILTAVGMLVIGLAGCTAPEYDITVYMSPKFIDVMKVYPSMEVDLVGMNANEVSRLKDATVDDYFGYGGELRLNTDKVTLHFSDHNVHPKRLSHSDPVWQIFSKKKADQLLLISNIPCDGGKDPAKDPRKVIIPLQKTYFFQYRKLYFEISPVGLIQLEQCPEDSPDTEIFQGKDARK